MVLPTCISFTRFLDMVRMRKRGREGNACFVLGADDDILDVIVSRGSN